MQSLEGLTETQLNWRPAAPDTNRLYGITTHVLGNAEENILATLDRERTHPRRGALTAREVLIVVARHAAEHWGEAQLTRSLLRTRAPAPGASV